MKLCSCCGALKEPGLFHWKRKSLGQREGFCKACKRVKLNREDLVILRKVRQAEYRKLRETPEQREARSRRHRAKPETRARNNQYRKDRRRKDPAFSIRINLSSQLSHFVGGDRKAGPLMEILGMCLREFRVYLQGQFRSGMSWENYGRVWHVDHIRPCASFDLTDHEQQKVCFRWDNLQPLFAKENLQKGDTWATKSC
jgi:hypothetical protein